MLSHLHLKCEKYHIIINFQAGKPQSFGINNTFIQKCILRIAFVRDKLSLKYIFEKLLKQNEDFETMLMIEPGFRILFTGDSITDCGRDRSNPRFLGNGYSMFISSLLGAKMPEFEFEMFNTGISGNRVADLKARWQKDCIELKPDVVSILIGVNDTWRRFDSNSPTSADAFASDYKFIIEKTLESLPGVQIVLLEPFLLPVPEDRRLWRADLDPKIHAVRNLAAEYSDVFVPLDGIFASAACRRNNAYWLPDGVHPSPYGHALIAEQWINYAGL